MYVDGASVQRAVCDTALPLTACMQHHVLQNRPLQNSYDWPNCILLLMGFVVTCCFFVVIYFVFVLSAMSSLSSSSLSSSSASSSSSLSSHQHYRHDQCHHHCWCCGSRGVCSSLGQRGAYICVWGPNILDDIGQPAPAHTATTISTEQWRPCYNLPSETAVLMWTLASVAATSQYLADWLPQMLWAPSCHGTHPLIAGRALTAR